MFNEVNVMNQENTYGTPPGDQSNGKDINQPLHPLILHLLILFRLRIQFLMQCCTHPRVQFENDI